MYGLLVGFGLMFDKGQKQSSTLSCDSSYFLSRLLIFPCSSSYEYLRKGHEESCFLGMQIQNDKSNHTADLL